ncbi:MAG: alpha/beta hydrolase [Oscillospiraceae bacterium]|nr:alpha/beta hydrolase [Oscillospiraceae bacterium]
MITEKFECVREGKTIRGRVYRPEGTKLPVMIVSHGFMANWRTVTMEAQFFAGHGYAAICFDYNGGGVGCKSDGKSTEMSSLTEKKDLLAVIDAVKKLPYVDPENISLCGCSHGGFVSAMVAAQLKDEIKRLVLYYPAFCMPDDARAGKMELARFDPNNVPETLRCGPMKLGRCFVTDIIGLDAYEEIKGYSGPVIIIHGTDDQIVNRSYSERAYKQYLDDQGGTPSANCQLVFIDKGNHGLRGIRRKMQMEYSFFAIEKFLEGKALVLNVDVNLTTKDTEKLQKGKRVKAYFTGISESPFFNGEVQPGAYDEQVYYGMTPDSCHAVYNVSGKDYTENECNVQIINDMPSGGKKDWAKGWKPTVSTDSDVLSFLNGQQCETYAEMRRSGPFIHIFARP